MLLRSWRNWQTRYFEGVVPKGVWVQIPSTAPSIKSDSCRNATVFFDYFAIRSIGQILTHQIKIPLTNRRKWYLFDGGLKTVADGECGISDVLIGFDDRR